MCEERGDPRHLTIGLLRSLTLLWLAGASLRLTLLALPPVLPAIEAELHLHGSDVGVLTAIPSLSFALAAVLGAALIGRFGAVPTLLAGLLINALGAAARGFADGVIGLEVATSVMCLGVAIMQPAMPTLVRAWTPGCVGLGAATYTCGLLCGEVLPILGPFASDLPVVGGGWRAALVQWSLPVLATALVIVLLRPGARQEKGGGAPRTWPNWRRGSVWKVALLLGAVNASYFGLNGFLPGWLSKAGGASTIQPALLALNAAQIPAALLMMIYLERLVFRRLGCALAGVATLAGGVGLATAPATFAVAFAALAGFALGFLLTLALALPPLMAAAEDVPSFSAGVFTLGYSMAVLTSLLTGVLEASGSSRWVSILPLAAAALSIVAVGATIRREPIGMTRDRTDERGR